MKKDGSQDLNITPESKTEPRGERSPREESYPDRRGKQGETGRTTTTRSPNPVARRAISDPPFQQLLNRHRLALADTESQPILLLRRKTKPVESARPIEPQPQCGFPPLFRLLQPFQGLQHPIKLAVDFLDSHLQSADAESSHGIDHEEPILDRPHEAERASGLVEHNPNGLLFSG